MYYGQCNSINSYREPTYSISEQMIATIRNDQPNPVVVNIYGAKPEGRTGKLSPLEYIMQVSIPKDGTNEIIIPKEYTFASFTINGVTGLYKLQYLKSHVERIIRITTNNIMTDANFQYGFRP